MKSRSPKLTEIPTVHQLSGNTTGNGNLQPEIDSDEYSSSKNYSSSLLLE